MLVGIPGDVETFFGWQLRFGRPEANRCARSANFSAVWQGCIDLTDSGLRVKDPKGSPHEDTVKKAVLRQGELHRSIQTGGVGAVACHRPQCGEAQAQFDPICPYYLSPLPGYFCCYAPTRIVPLLGKHSRPIVTQKVTM